MAGQAVTFLLLNAMSLPVSSFLGVAAGVAAACASTLPDSMMALIAQAAATDATFA
jgi:hypothetical protein